MNAVLRRVAREGRAELARLSAGDGTEALAVRHSHPDWLVALWSAELGRPAAEALMAADNQPAERCVRVNRLRATVAQAQAALAADGIVARPPAAGGDGGSPATPDALLIEGGPIESSAAFAQGLVTPQSRASQLAAIVAAAPLVDEGRGARRRPLRGARRQGLAARGAPAGRAHRRRSTTTPAGRPRCGRTSTRLGADERVAVIERDVLDLGADRSLRGAYQAVLLDDAPCSGLGTLASRADLRWRRRPVDVARLAALQARLLAGAAALVRAGRQPDLLRLHADACRDASKAN